MSGLTSFLTSPATFVYVIPGFIITWIRSQFLSGRITSNSSSLLYYLFVSFVYNAIVQVFIKDFQFIDFNICWFTVIVLVPVVTGILLGIEAQKEWTYKFLRYFRLNPIHPIETAWDKKFRNMNEKWIIIRLKNGNTFGGDYDYRSFSSSDPKERDIYINKDLQH